MAHDDRIFTFHDSDTDPEFPAASPTAHLLDELALYGYRPGQDEPDPRPFPNPMPCRPSSIMQSRRWAPC